MKFSVMILSASYLANAHLAAQSVIMTLNMFTYHIPFSVSVAVSTWLGNIIVAGSLKAAKIATKTYCIVFVFVCMGLM